MKLYLIATRNCGGEIEDLLTPQLERLEVLWAEV